MATFNIWKCGMKKQKEKDKDKEIEEEEYMFLTKAFFFSSHQVEKILEGGGKDAKEI